MRMIYTRQAQSFLVTDEGFYNRPAAHLIVPYMVRASSAIRSAPIEHRSAAIGMFYQPIHDAWAKIHRAMRPYFFANINNLFAGYNHGIELPDLEQMPHIHQSMHVCFDLLEDLDRVTALLFSDPNIEDASQEVFNCWMAVYRVTSRIEGIENRIRSGKAFNGKT